MVDNKILCNKMQLNICYPLKHQPLRTLTNAWFKWDCQDLRERLPTVSLSGCSKVQTSPSRCACGAQTTTGFPSHHMADVCPTVQYSLLKKNSAFALSPISSSSCTFHLTDHFYQCKYMLCNLPLKKKKKWLSGMSCPPLSFVLFLCSPLQ